MIGRTSSLLVAAVASLALAAACAQTASPGSPSPATSPTGGSGTAVPSGSATAAAAQAPRGSLIIGLDSLPPLYSIGTSGGAGGSNIYYWPVFDGLTRLSPDAVLEPALAQSWTTTDGKTWTFKLRTDVKWHDGTPFEAQDVKGTFDYYLNPANTVTAASVVADVERVDAPDPATVVFTLKQARPTFAKLIALGLIAKGRDLPLNDAQALNRYMQTAIGTGPFKFKRSDATTLEFEAVASGFQTPRGLPTYQQLTLRNVPEAASRSAALQTGEAQIIDNITADMARSLKPAGFETAVAKSVGGISLTMPLTEGPTANLVVRRALNHAINRKGIIDSLLSGVEEADGQLIGPSALGYNQAAQPYAFDTARARQLMTEAGFPNGFTIPIQTFAAFLNPQISEALAADLRNAGVNAPIQQLDAAVWRTAFYGPPNLRNGLFVQAISWDQTFKSDVVYRFYSADFTVEGGRRWDNPQFNDLFQRAKSNLDENTRRQLYQQAAQIIHDEAPALFLWMQARQAAFDSKKVGYDYTGYFANMWTGKVTPKD